MAESVRAGIYSARNRRALNRQVESAPIRLGTNKQRDNNTRMPFGRMNIECTLYNIRKLTKAVEDIVNERGVHNY